MSSADIVDESQLSSEELAEQAAHAEELAALNAQLSATTSGDAASGDSTDDDDDDDDLLGDTDALLAAATAAADKARAAAAQAEGVDVSRSAAHAQRTLASARASAQEAATEVSQSSQANEVEDDLEKGAGVAAGTPDAEDSENDAEEDSAPRQSVLTNANWDERLRAEREAEVMAIIAPIVQQDAEKLSFFKQASKMFRAGSVTPQQFMTALTKLFGGPTARKVIPLLADAVPDANRRAELHDAFRAAERDAAVARAGAQSGRSGAAAPAPRVAATVPATSSHTSTTGTAPQQPLFSVPSASAAPPSSSIAFGSPAPGEAADSDDSDAPKPAPSAARQALFADEEAPSAAPVRAAEEPEVQASALPATAVSGGVAFDPLSAPPAPEPAPASAAAIDPLTAPSASASDPLSAPPAVPAAGATSQGEPGTSAAQPADGDNVFASASGEGRAAANGVGTPGSSSTGGGGVPAATSAAAGGRSPEGRSNLFSGLFAAPSHLREGVAVDGGGGDEEEGGSIVASCPHDGGQLTVAMWDTMSQSDDSGRTFTLYALRCTWVRENRKVQWLVGRRYSEFELLRSSLTATLQHHPQCAGRIMPPLPGKTLFGSNSDAVVGERRTKLAVFLLQLFQTFPIVLRTTEMDSFLKVTPRIGAVVNEFLEREADGARAPQDSAAPAATPPAEVPACAQYFLMLHTPVALNLEHLNRHAVRLCSVFKAMVQRPPVLNGAPPSRDAVLQETARAADVAQRCLEASAAAATDEDKVESLQLGGATVDTYLTHVLECQDRLQWCTAELASLQASAAAAGMQE